MLLHTGINDFDLTYKFKKFILFGSYKYSASSVIQTPSDKLPKKVWISEIHVHICDMQNASRVTALFSNIPTFRQVRRVPQSISFYHSTFN